MGGPVHKMQNQNQKVTQEKEGCQTKTSVSMSRVLFCFHFLLGGIFQSGRLILPTETSLQ